MDLAKDILDVAEKVGQAPGLAIASSIVTSILKTVETSKNNTLRLKTLAHSLAIQLIDISETMKGNWDDAPLTLKRTVDEYDAFLLAMLKSIIQLSQHSRLRAFVLAGEHEREITRLEKSVADVRSTITMTIGMNLSVAINQVQTSLGHVGREVHFGLVDGARPLDLEPYSLHTTPEFSLFTREDFQVTKTLSRHVTYDQQRRDVMTVTIHQAERCINGRAICVKTFDGDDPLRVRRQFSKQLEMSKRALNPALLQIIGWSSATAQIPFHVYHAPGGIVEPFWTWARRTLRSNTVETIFGLYDMRHSIKELHEFGRSRHVGFWDVFGNGVVHIQHHSDRPQFALIFTGDFFSEHRRLHKEYSRQDHVKYIELDFAEMFEPKQSDNTLLTSDVLPTSALAAMFAGGAKNWFGDPHGIEALFKRNYITIDPLHLGPALLEAGWLGTSCMVVMCPGDMRLGDVGYVAQDGHFKVVTNLHMRLVSRTGGPPRWGYKRYSLRYSFLAGEVLEGEYAVVTHSETVYRRYPLVFPPYSRPFLRHRRHRAKYIDLDERHAWKTLHKEAFRIIESNNLSIAPQDLKLCTSIKHLFEFSVGRRHDWFADVEPNEQEDLTSDPATITVYEFEREGLFSMLDSGVPEHNPQVFYSFQDNVGRVDPTEIQRHPETGDILIEQALKRPTIHVLQLPLGVTRPSG